MRFNVGDMRAFGCKVFTADATVDEWVNNVKTGKKVKAIFLKVVSPSIGEFSAKAGKKTLELGYDTVEKRIDEVNVDTSIEEFEINGELIKPKRPISRFWLSNNNLQWKESVK